VSDGPSASDWPCASQPVVRVPPVVRVTHGSDGGAHAPTVAPLMTPQCAEANEVLHAASADAGVTARRVANQVQHTAGVNADE